MLCHNPRIQFYRLLTLYIERNPNNETGFVWIVNNPYFLTDWYIMMRYVTSRCTFKTSPIPSPIIWIAVRFVARWREEGKIRRWNASSGREPIHCDRLMTASCHLKFENVKLNLVFSPVGLSNIRDTQGGRGPGSTNCTGNAHSFIKVRESIMYHQPPIKPV